jgi:hypothetical protein
MDFLWRSYYISGYKKLWEKFYQNSHFEMWILYIFNISLKYKSRGFYRYRMWYTVNSTHHEIKNTPLVLRVFLWRHVSHCNSHNFLTARDRFFFLFLSIRKKPIYKSYTLDIVVRLTPKSLHPRSQIKNILFSNHKRRVKTDLFLNW